MPAYAAQRRGSLRSKRTPRDSLDDVESAAPPAEISIQVRLSDKLMGAAGYEMCNAVACLVDWGRVQEPLML